MWSCYLLLQVALGSACWAALPLVDPGLFVISGVKTCGNGNGYCLLGLDCTLDEDFVPDDLEGHCEGLKYAFTPSAHFVCCKAANLSLDYGTMVSEEDGNQNTTTPNVLDNEIEQVLLKLAESINSAKKNTSKRPEGSVTVANVTESSEEENTVKNEAEWMTESYEEEEEMSGENLTTPDLSGDEANGENHTNLDAEWMDMFNRSVHDHREDIINKVTIKTDLDEINDVVISTLDRNEQLNNLDASFYSIMQKEIEHMMREDVNSTVDVPTEAVYNQSVIHDTDRCADIHDCASVSFVYEENLVCFGSILSEEWVLTSASCALRIFRVGMQNITTQRLNSSEHTLLKTIVVHEDYREPSSDTSQIIDANNIGLVRIRNPMESWKSCLPCLPYLGQDFSGNNCSALFNYTRSERLQRVQPEVRMSAVEASAKQSTTPLCEGKVEPLVGEYGDVSYLTLACGSSWKSRDNNILMESGSPLLCNGVLAGIETSSGVGTLVYTPVSRYMGWLGDNAKHTTQTFYDI